MIKENLFEPEAFSYHTLFRFLKQKQLSKIKGREGIARSKDRKKFRL